MILNGLKKTVFILSLVLFAGACDRRAEVKRDRDPWVFRSVLDQRARMVTLALNEKLWAAYDAQACGLYKVWQGGVKLEGAVYNTVHGPQPTSEGSAFLTDDLAGKIWSVKKDGAEQKFRLVYRGHVFEGKKVSFRYELVLEDGTIIKVSEQPEFILQHEKPGLEREFTTENVPDGFSVELQTKLGYLSSKEDFSTNGTFNITEEKEESFEGFKVLSVSGVLVLKPNTGTLLTSFFEPKVSGGKAK